MISRWGGEEAVLAYSYDSLGEQWSRQTRLSELLKDAVKVISGICGSPCVAIVFREPTGKTIFQFEGPLSEPTVSDLRCWLERGSWEYAEYGAEEVTREFASGFQLGIRACVTIPVNRHGDLSGMIGLFYDAKPPLQRKMLEDVSAQLYLAANRCWLYQRERQMVNLLQETRNEAAELKRKYDRLFTLQKQFADLNAVVDGFDPIVGKLGELLKEPILLLDKDLRLLASYTPPVPLETAWIRSLEERRLDPAFADRPSFQHAIRRVQSGDMIPVTLESSSNGARELYWLAALQSGSSVWCYLLWRGVLPPLPKETAHTIQMAGVALTLSYFYQFEQTLQQRPSFLEAFLAGQYSSTESALEQARLQGCDIQKMNKIIIIEPEKTDRSMSELRSLIESAVGGMNCAFYSGVYAETIVILLDFDADEKAVSKAIYDRLRANDIPILLGVSRSFRDMEDLRSAFDEVRRSLALSRKWGKHNTVVYYESLGVYRLLLNTDRAALEDTIHKAMGPLLRVEKKQSDELLSTLMHYLRTGGSIQQAAELCFVHINTVKYRLKRISQMLDADLSHPDERFKLDFALRAMEILEL
ncbi:helix-turn-helix domain-containing protein [Paenibacillus sp. Pae108]|uniref:helix-turn-helix domain-containing protein n=1 Tax=Paenibacillus sp. Pae108 TaxID=2926019 RepID=UPI0021181715|nr:helix-turn-helix domain-containing protein [Paenibacillus sp. Pae108]